MSCVCEQDSKLNTVCDLVTTDVAAKPTDISKMIPYHCKKSVLFIDVGLQQHTSAQRVNTHTSQLCLLQCAHSVCGATSVNAFVFFYV